MNGSLGQSVCRRVRRLIPQSPAGIDHRFATINVRQPDAGFTLIELLVVIGVLLTLAAVTVTVFRASSGGDRMRSSARISQSALMGAKDRALHAQQRRGVRLIRDTSDPNFITGFMYLQPIEQQPVGGASNPMEIRRPSSGGTVTSTDPTIVRVRVGVISNLRDFLAFPSKIKIPNSGTGQWYVYQNIRPDPDDANFELIDLIVPYASPEDSDTTAIVAVPYTSPNATALLEISNEPLPFHQPISLPSGVVIDTRYSTLPPLWTTQRSIPDATAVPAGWIDVGDDPGNTANKLIRPANLDIEFSPRGTMTGSIVASGIVCLLLRDIQDATMGLDPRDNACKGESLAIGVFPMTGLVQTYPADLTPGGDLFSFVKKGDRAGQ